MLRTLRSLRFKRSSNHHQGTETWNWKWWWNGWWKSSDSPRCFVRFVASNYERNTSQKFHEISMCFGMFGKFNKLRHLTRFEESNPQSEWIYSNLMMSVCLYFILLNENLSSFLLLCSWSQLQELHGTQAISAPLSCFHDWSTNPPLTYPPRNKALLRAY